MSRRVINFNRLILVLGGLVILLGGAAGWALTHGYGFRFEEPDPAERVLDQVRDHLGPRAEVRYMEEGTGVVVCGYAGRRGEAQAVEFISRPNRILLGDDPLRDEFETMLKTACPGFARLQPAAAR